MRKSESDLLQNHPNIECARGSVQCFLNAERRKAEEQKRGGVECQIKHPLHHQYERPHGPSGRRRNGQITAKQGAIHPPVLRRRGTRAGGIVFYYISLQKFFRFFKRKALIFVKICRKSGAEGHLSPHRRPISPAGPVFAPGTRLWYNKEKIFKRRDTFALPAVY